MILTVRRPLPTRPSLTGRGRRGPSSGVGGRLDLEPLLVAADDEEAPPVRLVGARPHLGLRPVQLDGDVDDARRAVGNALAAAGDGERVFEVVEARRGPLEREAGRGDRREAISDWPKRGTSRLFLGGLTAFPPTRRRPSRRRCGPRAAASERPPGLPRPPFRRDQAKRSSTPLCLRSSALEIHAPKLPSLSQTGWPSSVDATPIARVSAALSLNEGPSRHFSCSQASTGMQRALPSRQRYASGDFNRANTALAGSPAAIFAGSTMLKLSSAGFSFTCTGAGAAP